MQIRPKPLVIDPNNPYTEDSLNRKESVSFLKGIIAKAQGPLVLAIDSPWGTGKTTLVNMLRAELERDGFKTIYFNAWKSDFATDPLVAMVAKLDEEDGQTPTGSVDSFKKLRRITTIVAKHGAIAAIKAGTLGALNIDSAIEAVMSDGAGDAALDLVEIAKKETVYLEKFREELEKTVSTLKGLGKQDNLVYFVDELDRCRPNFAIELLERIKHLFDVPNVIFALAIDKNQLEASTTAIYGSNINAREYLRRFIDIEFRLPALVNEDFIRQAIKRFGIEEKLSARNSHHSDTEDLLETFTAIAAAAKMSLRAQEQCISRLAIVLEQTPSNYHLFPVLAATLVSVSTLNQKLFSEIRSGAASTEELMAWLRELDAASILKNSRASCAIESYMNAADPNTSRRDQRIKRIEIACNAVNTDEPGKEYLRDVLDLSNRLRSAFRGAVKLSFVINKIDFAENIKN